MVMHRHRYKSVGAKVLNEEHDEFSKIARARGIAPGTLCRRLIQDEIARNATPETEELCAYA